MNRPQTVHLSAILTMVASMACLSTQDTFSKLLMLTLTPMIIIWTRYGVQTAMITAIILRKKSPLLFTSQQAKLQLLRGCLVVGGSLFGYGALQRIPVAEFTAIYCLVPLAVTLLARFVLKEKVNAIGWLFIAGGMTGAELGLLAFVAVAGSYGQFFMVLAFAKAPASVLSPYLYSAIGFSALGGWLMFNHLPDLWALIGMLMIAGFGLASAWFNRR